MSIIPEGAIGSCARCQFFAFREEQKYKDCNLPIPGSQISRCHRYPQTVNVKALHWCGEFKECQS